jgi:hypothetical protein
MTPTTALTRHFLENATGRAWLDEEGVAGLRAVFFSALAGLGSLGLFLPRHFSRLYLDLSALPTPGPYREQLMADSLFMLTLPALVTAWAAIALSPSMFPDETDYVALGALPLTRRQIFGAKVLALALLIGALTAVMILMFGLAFPSFSHGRWAEASRGARVLAHVAAGMASSTFAVLAVTSLEGLLLTTLPRRWLATVSTAMQSGLMGALVLTLPFVLRMPKAGAWLAAEPEALFFVPSGWFLGLEQLLLGRRSPFFDQLALLAGAGLAVTLLVAGACYLILYRRVESLLAPPDRGRVGPARPVRLPAPRRWRAVWHFTTATLARTRHSQILFLVAWAVGIAMAINVLLGAGLTTWMTTGRLPRSLMNAAITLPLPMIVMGLLGVRAAFLLPVSSRANWIFRILDTAVERRGHLAAVDRAFVLLGIFPAVVLAAPLQFLTLHPAVAAGAVVANVIAALLLTELMLLGWRRVPFTCSWLPGKRPLPLLVVGALVAVIALMILGALMVVAVQSIAAFAVVGTVLLVPALALRVHRVRTWAVLPLQFEDEPPDRLQQLGLHIS